MVRARSLVAVVVLSGAGCIQLPAGGDNPFGAPEFCFNDVLDGNESDVDCGGSCTPCSAGAKCNSPGDCADPLCAFGRCAPLGSSCFDRARDGQETDVDCGGGCAKCAAGKRCTVATDCESGSCAAGVCGPGGGPFSFAAPRRNADPPKHPVALAVADLDLDGKLDVVTANEDARSITVLGGAGDGSLKAGTDFPVGAGPRWVGAADLDEDGRPDLVVLPDSGGFQLISSRGGLDYGAAPRTVMSATTFRPVAASLADLDGDGHIDVTLSSGAGQLTRFRNLGRGAFDTGSILGPPGIGPSRLLAADVDGDASLEVVVIADTLVKILSPRMPGASGIDVSTTVLPYALALPQLRRDAGPRAPRDLVVTDVNSGLAVLLARGDGSFAQPVLYETGSSPMAVAAADFDGDGSTDVVTCNQGTTDLSLFAGHGDGTLEAPIALWIGESPEDMVVADMNGDGRPDIVVCDYWQHDVAVLLNLKK